METMNKIKEKYFEIKPFYKKAIKQKNIFMQIIDIIIHKILLNTSPIDYYRFEFFDNKKTLEEKSYYVGKRGSRYFPFDSNDIKYVPIFDNKYIFKVMVKGYGLPQTECICTTGKKFGDIYNIDQFTTIMSKIKNDFVVKPIEGSGGNGIIVCKKLNDKIYTDGKKISHDYLWNIVKNGDYLIEQKLEQIKQLSKIYPKSLNTLRITTYQTENRKIFILLRFIKFGTDGRCVDNAGLGGIIGFIDEQGKIIYCYNYKKHIFNIMKHPDTGHIIKGINVEKFQDAIDLAIKAAKKFNFVGTIGWDIAITDKGPLLLEGNIFYDCWVVQIDKCGSILNQEIAKYLTKYHMFKRYDKTKIYPHFNRKRIVA